ncbi:FAD-dependent oxidoreductase [Amycolatopsis sp. NPDC051128]|uniref:FAD-dependent oxidoreductase n=1 Tax=Amycolatopsis sp. NPDC051128 TaxID=3155412 RepID=UPI00342674DD
MTNEAVPCPVVIAGAGPVGLMAACELASAGIPVLVLERRSQPDRILKAGSVGPLAIEALDRLGLRAELAEAEEATMAGYAKMAEEARAAGDQVAVDALDKAQREHFAGLEKLDFARRSDPARRRMRVPQPALVEILRRRAGQLGVTVLTAHEVVGLTQDDEGVTVVADTPRGRRELRTAYLLGCDGGSSAVRRLAGFGFPGTAATMLGRQGVVELADPAQLPAGIHEVEHGILVWGLGVDRVAALEFSPESTELGPITREELHTAVARVSGIDLGITEFKAGGRFNDEARLAADYRSGRVLLAGDAAHIHAPVGGQGLNVGLIDAVNIAWKLAARLRGWTGDDLLDTYGAERRPVAEALLDNTRAQIALMRPDSHSRALRRLFAEILELDEVNLFIGDLMAGLDTRYEFGDADPLVGTLCPDVKLPGPVERLAALPHDGRGVLLWQGGQPPAFVTRWAERVRVVTGGTGETGAEALLLRPDACVAWVARPGVPADLAALETALGTWFGVPA